MSFANPKMEMGALTLELGKIPTDWYNVKAFGAKLDGVTDDTEAIQLAINTAGQNGVVFFPPGTAKITAALVGKYGQKFIGCGPNVSIIRAYADHDILSFASTDDKGIRYVLVQGLHLRGYNADGTNHCLRFTGAIECEVIGCYIAGAPDNGIYVEELAGVDPLHVTPHNIRISRCTITGSHGWGIHSSANSITIEMCRIQGNTLGGIYQRRSSITVLGCDIEGNGDAGADSEAGICLDYGEGGASIVGCYFESNRPTHILIGPNYDFWGVDISGCRMYGGAISTQRSIWVKGGQGISIRGNIIRSSHTAGITLEARNTAVNPKGARDVVIEGNCWESNVADIVDNGATVGTVTTASNGELGE